MASFDPRLNGAASEASKHAQAKFELGIALALDSWQDLTVAVQNGWGGPDSEDKRDFLAGSVAELFETDPDTDGDDVADRLVQVLEDEFEVVIDDNSEVQVATTIMRIWHETHEGNFATVDQMYERWKQRKERGLPPVQVQVQEQSGEEVDDDDWDEGEEAEDGDGQMLDATPSTDSAPTREKPPPEVDDEGFTKVVGRKKR